jgi:outer membrane protein OmpA-like peptidoglycan-associated protein
MKKTAFLALAGLALAGCTTHADGTTSTNKTAVGATLGAVTGGILGNRASSDHLKRNTVIGAAAGAAVGGGIGYMMDRQEAELRDQLASERMANAVEVERVREDMLKLILANEVSFDVNSATVKPAFRPTMRKLADVLGKYDQNRVTIVGHTDSTGSEAYNQTLSERRARAVRDELILLGVPSDRLSAMGQGERQPRANNDTTAGREMNRRVEVLVQPTA